MQLVVSVAATGLWVLATAVGLGYWCGKKLERLESGVDRLKEQVQKLEDRLDDLQKRGPTRPI